MDLVKKPTSIRTKTNINCWTVGADLIAHMGKKKIEKEL